MCAKQGFLKRCAKLRAQNLLEFRYSKYYFLIPTGINFNVQITSKQDFYAGNKRKGSPITV